MHERPGIEVAGLVHDGPGLVAAEGQDLVDDAEVMIGESSKGHVNARSNKPATYDPSEKHEATEYVVLPIGDDLATRMKAARRQ
jgi:hypothetical protein